MQGRQRNHRGQGALLRRELVDAAMRILDRSPAAELSLRTVAREAGVAAPSAYAHFPSAQAMFTAVVRECWSELGDAMGRAALEGDPLEDLQARMAAYVSYAMERPSRYQLLFAAQPIEIDDIETPGPVSPAYRNVRSCLSRMLERGWILPAPDDHFAAVLTLSLAHGRVAIAHTSPNRPQNAPDNVQTFVRTAIERLFPVPDAARAQPSNEP